MGLTISHKIFFDIPHIRFECGEYQRIFRGILSVPQNNVMDLNYVTHPLNRLSTYFKNLDVNKTYIHSSSALHNIIHIHNNVIWDWQYPTIFFLIFPTFSLYVGNIKEYTVKSHKTMLWIWIMLCILWMDFQHISKTLMSSELTYTTRVPFITLFEFITTFCGTDNIPQNILQYSPHSVWMWGISKNISWDTVSPTKHYYGFE